MALKKCEKCGVFFGSENGETLCNNCKFPKTKKYIITGDVEHDKFTNIRSMVYQHPHITPKELVAEMESVNIIITVKEILKYVTDGRLVLVTEDGGSYCSECGRKIMIGSMCSSCSDKLEQFRNPPKPKKVEPKKNIGMRSK